MYGPYIVYTRFIHFTELHELILQLNGEGQCSNLISVIEIFVARFGK